MTISYDEYIKKKKKENEKSETDRLIEQFLAERGDAQKVVDKAMDFSKQTVLAKKDDIEKRTWFEGGAFKDGYQFGDVSKTITGTVTDAYHDIMKGGGRIGESLIDTGGYVVGGVAKAFGQDQFAEDTKKFVARNLIDEMGTTEMATHYSALGLINNVLHGNLEPYNPKVFLDSYANAIYSLAGLEEESANKTAGQSDEFIEKSSVLGDKSDSLVQSAGQLVGTVALQGAGVPWFLTTGVTGFGGGVEEAFQEDAGYVEAGVSGGVTALAEILTEKIFGGISFGGKTLDDIIPIKETLTKNISNKVAKTLVKFGIDAVGEGTEEVISEAISNVGKLSYQDKTLQEALFSEEAFDQYLESFIGGMALGGGVNVGKTVNSIKTGRDYDTGLTENEQKVLDTEKTNRTTEIQKKKAVEEKINDIIKEREATFGTLSESEKKNIAKKVQEQLDNGEIDYSNSKLTNKELKNIDEQVRKDLERGEISIETIESTLLSDKTAQIKELEAQLSKTTNPDKKAQIQAQINELQTAKATDLQEMLKKDGVLQASYREANLRSQKFEYEAKETDSEYRKALAEDFKRVANNSTKSHETFEMISKIAEDKQTSYGVINNEQLKELGYEVEGKTVNGLVRVNEDGSQKVLINIDSDKAINRIVGHETTHVLEGTKEYDEFQELVKQYATTKGEYDSRLKELKKLYKGTNANIENELTADLVGDYLFTDTDFINNLSTEKPNIFKKIYDEIKHLVKMATAGSKEARELEKVKRAFEKAYRQNVATQTDAKTGQTSIVDNKELYNYIKENKMLVSATDNLVEILESGKFDASKTSIGSYNKGTAISEYGKYRIHLKPEVLDNVDKMYKGDGATRTEYKKESTKTFDTVEEMVHNDPKTSTGQATYDEFTVKNDISTDMIDKVEIPTGTDQSVIDLLNEKGIKYEEYTAKPKSNTDEGSLLSMFGKKPKSKETDNKYAGRFADGTETQLRQAERNLKSNIERLESTVEAQGRMNKTTEGQFSKRLESNKNSLKEVKLQYEELLNEFEKRGMQPDTRYSLSDNQGRELSPEQQEFFKDSKVRDENGNLLTVYHTMTEKGQQFNEFNPVGTPGYRFGEQTVIYFTDSKEMSGSYANQEYKMADTKTFKTIDDVNQWLAEKSAVLDRHYIKEVDGKYYLYNNNLPTRHSWDNIQTMFNEVRDKFYENPFYSVDNKPRNFQYEGYVNITNPYVIDAEGENWNSVSQEYSKEIENRFASLTTEEKESLTKVARNHGELGIKPILTKATELAESGESFSYFGTKYSSEDAKNLANAYVKLREGTGMTPTYKSIYRVAEQNFKKMWIETASVVELTTNDIVRRVIEENKNGTNYDGVIIKETIDYGSKVEELTPHDVYVAFNSNQFKAVDNKKPTSDPDIRYSLSDYQEYTNEINATLEKAKNLDEKFYNDLIAQQEEYRERHQLEYNILEETNSRPATNENINSNFFKEHRSEYDGNSGQKLADGILTVMHLQKGDNLAKLSFTEGEDKIWIDELYVKNQKQGYGSEIVNAIKKYAEENGKYVEAFKELSTAKGFWDKTLRSNADIRYSLSDVDSELDPLTDAQREYFKNTVVKDQDNELEVVYHGTPNMFTVFDINKSDLGQYGIGWYFTNSKGTAQAFSGENENILEGYLNIENPASTKEKTIAFSDFKRLYNELSNNQSYVDEDGFSIIDDVLSNYGDVNSEGVDKVLRNFYDMQNTDSDLIDNLAYKTNKKEILYDTVRKVTGLDGIVIERPSNFDAFEKYYIAFNPNQFKNKDNLNPTDSDDIRYSMSNPNEQIAPVRGDIFGRDIKYGASIPEVTEDIAPVRSEAIKPRPTKTKQPRMARVKPGEAPGERVVLPSIATGEQVATPSDGMKQRRWVKTSTESDVVDGAITPEGLDQELIHYEVKTNASSLGKANQKLDDMGYDKAVTYFNAQINNKRTSVEDIVLGERLIQEAIKKGDTKTAGELIQNVAILGTELGQKVQALSIIQRLTPEGQLKMLQKIIDRGKVKEDIAFKNIELTQDQIDRILNVYNQDGSYDQDQLNEVMEQIKNEIAKQMPTTKMEKTNAWRYLSMLGNPKTHIRNVVSNVAMRGTLEVKNAVARTIETVVPIENRTKTWKKSSKAVDMYADKVTEDMKEIISGDSKYNEEADIKSRRDMFKNGVLNKIYNFNSDLLAKEDWWFSRPVFKNSFKEYLTANGIETDADIQNNQKIVEKAKLYALEQSQEATFRQYSWLANKIRDIEQKNVVTQIAVGSVIPFKKTPINVAKTGLAYSPLGFAKTLTYDIVQVKKGNMEASQLIDNIAKNSVGTALTLVGYMLAKAGFLSGGGDDDKEGKYDYQLGEQGYSLRINGQSYSLSWLSPVAIPMFVGANAYEQLEEDKEWNGDVVMETLAKTLDPLSEMSFLSGLNDVLSSYDSGMQKFAGIGEAMIGNYASQFIPTASSQLASTLDDTKRSTKVSGDSGWKFAEGLYNQMAYKIPGLRNTLEPSTDIWGNEVKQSDNILERALESFIVPYSRKEHIGTEIDQELKDLYAETGDNGILPSIPSNYVNFKNEKYKMSASEYTEFKKTYGQTANDWLEELFGTSTYQNATAEDKADLVNKVYDYARDEAKREYLEKEGVEYTNAKKDDVEYYKENSIKEAILNDITPDAQSYASKNPENFAIISQIGSYEDYKGYKEAINDIKEQYKSTDEMTSQQKTYLSRLRKQAVQEYIEGLSLTVPQKIMLEKTAGGYSIKSYENYMFGYIESLPLTAEEKREIHKQLFD